jgi:hypothetical protein
MNMMNTSSKSLVLRGTVISQGASFLATVDNLPLVSYGDTAEEAENRLVREFRNWAEVCEEKGMLEKTLVEAGYREVDEQTEIYLIFTDEDEEE